MITVLLPIHRHYVDLLCLIQELSTCHNYMIGCVGFNGLACISFIFSFSLFSLVSLSCTLISLVPAQFQTDIDYCKVCKEREREICDCATY